MLKASVVGTATSTVKHSSLAGARMLVVQPYGPDGTTPDGHPLLAIDTCCGAGTGDEIMITSDGRNAREALNCDTTPVRWTVIGICDK
ncbi:EutN/CcmL family microcompartment protein [Aeoliella sp. ICT_H6.2]|uniref:EutN/CcmL family microcompartment protein n=1 Tax=Aeoliella straminimaris TaxID=2954799 RepID=A0A9X2F8Q2_9BACT|nr:EutN/CcmL family microcompartment protein [Aeoliella straminimaris]MCO6044405.1 EutN/CcmL family microcompartment protein [Aeoliella straminimaris]